MNVKVIHGDILYTETPEAFTCMNNGYLVAEAGKVTGVWRELPERYAACPVADFRNHLIMPGFVDLHVHAPQYENAALGYDLELMPWLQAYTFPEEAKYQDLAYAGKVYSQFINDLIFCGTTRAAVFATIHKEATGILVQLFQKSGLGAFIGKVNMDQNAIPQLTENTVQSLENTKTFLSGWHDVSLVKPIITPRFVPACSEGLLAGLGELAIENQVPVQSHLAENRDEIAFVKSLYPEAKSYAAVYDQFGLFGQTPTVMAHCVHTMEAEKELMKEKGVYVAHCPFSNANLRSGIAPVKEYLHKGIRTGMGSDVAGGHTLDMAKVLVEAVGQSKLYYVHVDDSYGSLSLPEAFYLATKGGGEFFGQVGSFETGYAFDALVIDDRSTNKNNPRNLAERIAKYLYTGHPGQIVKRYVAGKEVVSMPGTY